MKKSSEKGNVFAVIATTVAVLSLAANIYFYLDTSSINAITAVKESCEKECTKDKANLTSYFEQKLELRTEIERSLNKQQDELHAEISDLDLEVKALEKRIDELFAENMMYQGKNMGHVATIEQLKQLLSSQGKMNKYVEENFVLRGKVAQLNTVIKLKDGKYDGLKEKMIQAKKDIAIYKSDIRDLNISFHNEQKITGRLKAERSNLKDVYQQLSNSHDNLKINIVSDLERFYDTVKDAMVAKNGKRKSANNRVRTKFDSILPRYQKQEKTDIQNVFFSYSGS